MRKKELMIVVMIALVSFAGFLTYRAQNAQKQYAIVTDTYKDEVVLRFDINEDAYYEIDVLNGKFHIEVKDGKYRAIDVDCPNQLCVQMGWMPSMDYYAPIVCLPNGIIITIEE